MATNDFCSIPTQKQLRAALKTLSSDRASLEKTFSARMDNFRQLLQLRKLLLYAINVFRKKISGTPFAKS